MLEARLARESADFGGTTRGVLKEAIEALKAKGGEPKEAIRVTAERAKTIADLELQAADLEKKTKELRSRISALKQCRSRGGRRPARRAPTRHRDPTPGMPLKTFDSSRWIWPEGSWRFKKNIIAVCGVIARSSSARVSTQTRPAWPRRV